MEHSGWGLLHCQPILSVQLSAETTYRRNDAITLALPVGNIPFMINHNVASFTRGIGPHNPLHRLDGANIWLLVLVSIQRWLCCCIKLSWECCYLCVWLGVSLNFDCGYSLKSPSGGGPFHGMQRLSGKELMFLTGECLTGDNLLNRNKHPTIRTLVHLSTYLQLQTANSSWTVNGL